MPRGILGGHTTALVLLIVVAHASVAMALVTVETFDTGSTDTEYYVGFRGIGLAEVDREFSHEFVAGYGFSKRFSAYTGACVEGDQAFLAGDSSLHFGAVGTVRDGERVDLDLLLSLAASGRDLDNVVVEQFVEFNYDQDPEMRSWGVYLRFGVVAQHRTESAEGSTQSVRRRLFDLGINPGVYYMFSDRHQLLIEFDASLAMGARRLANEQTRGVGLGWNALLTDSLELIAEVYREIPGGGGASRFNFSLGFIATLPSGG